MPYRILYITILLLGLFVFPHKGHGQRVIEKKLEHDLELVHKATFNFALMYEFTLFYQLGFRSGKNTFYVGFGPGFYTHSFRNECNFLGLGSGLEYSYGKKWSFDFGLYAFNGWNWKWDHISPFGACVQRSKALLCLPIGASYTADNGLTVGLAYYPRLEIKERGNTFYPLNFNFRIGFCAITKLI